MGHSATMEGRINGDEVEVTERLMQGFHTGPHFQITRVWAKNFRSIADVSFELDPLTILVGPNASGKSNLLDILRFIKDALRNLEMAVSRRNGMEGVARHVAWDGDSNLLDIEMGLAAIVRDHHAEHGYYSIEYGFTLAYMDNGGYWVSSEYGNVMNGDDSAVAEFRIEDGSLTVSDLHMMGLPPYFDSDFDTDNLALPILLRLSRRPTGSDIEEIGHTVSLVQDGLRKFHRNLTGMRFYHIFPNTIREPQRLSNAPILEEDAANLASSIRDLDRAGSIISDPFKESLRLLIPGVSDISVDPVGRFLVVKLKHDAINGDPWLDLSMESDGTVRLLGLLAALYQRRRPPMIGIEEPELTVHPGALAVLADLLNEASRRSQVIVTTHSPDFIDFLTDYRAVESLRIVEMDSGATTVRQVGDNQIKAVKKHLFSPGELYRMGEITVRR